MGIRRRMKDHYRSLPFLTDLGGIRSAIGEARGKGFPKQPALNREYEAGPGDSVPDEQWFIDTITEKVANHPDNSMEYPHYGERIYDEPLVGFVRGDDPLLDDYKRIIGPHHFTPEEIMAWQAKKNGVPAPKAEDLSVVSFIMPINKKTREDNRSRKEWTSERWAQTRLMGEIYSQIMVREIVSHLMGRGILAVSPDVTPMFNKKRYPVVGWASPWSHRHMAYAAGLGSFGIHDFFITEKGCALRTGSFVVNLKLEPNRVRPADIHAHCLHYQGIPCLACKSRCPAGAISAEGGHDKEACMQRVGSSLRYCIKNYHIFIYGCGLCATGTPCESAIPEALMKGTGR
jgi:epoxyqueuosine reductase